MTQKAFFDTNISIVKEKKDVSYKLCDGVIISFESNNSKSEYRLLLNGHEVERKQKYSNYAIKNSFLFITNNMRSFQWYPFEDGKTYAIQRNIEIPNKINWNDVVIVEQ